jgi:hypothetical protein
MLHYTAAILFLQSNFTIKFTVNSLESGPNFANSADAVCCLIINLVMLMAKDLQKVQARLRIFRPNPPDDSAIAEPR